MKFDDLDRQMRVYETAACIEEVDIDEEKYAPNNAQRSCVDVQNQHGVAHKDGLQDDQKREGFSLSSAPVREEGKYDGET